MIGAPPATPPTLTAMRRLTSLLLTLPLAVILAACASPETDWRAAEVEASAFLEAASSGADVLGSGSYPSRPGNEPLGGNAGVELTYESGHRVDGVRMACFGDGGGRFGVVVRTESTWTGLESVALVCDGTDQELSMSAPIADVNAIRVSGVPDHGSGAVVAAVIYGSSD